MHPYSRRHDADESPEKRQDHDIKAVDIIELSSTNGTSYWDEATIVSPIRQLASPASSRVTPKKTTSSSIMALKGQKPECLVCGLCGKGAINQAELNNHLEIMHRVDPEKVWDDVVGQKPAQTAQTAGEEPLLDHSEVTIKPQEHVDDDRTIKAVPMPLTPASLQAHDSSSSEALAQSMDGLSMSQRRESSPSEMSFADTTYTVDDVDSQTVSVVAERDSPGIREPVRILIYLFLKLFLDFSRRYSANVQEHAPIASGNARRGSAAQITESLATSSVSSSQASGVKRQRDHDDNEDEQERKNNKSRRKSEQASPDHVIPLACPFNKFDSKTFGVDGSNTYHVCSTFSDVKTAYFKYVQPFYESFGC